MPRLFPLAGFLFSLVCAAASASSDAILISVPDQQLLLFRDGVRIAQYPVSTSRYGLGDRPNSYATPVGWMEVAAKVGAGAPLGAVFKSRRATGEVLRPNAPGRDPIVTRILWLRGLEASNRNAFGRLIYIHGTPQERLIGRPASYGCVRMRSRDVADLFARIAVGAKVQISTSRVRRAAPGFAAAAARLFPGEAPGRLAGKANAIASVGHGRSVL